MDVSIASYWISDIVYITNRRRKPKRGEVMAMYYVIEVLQTQAFDVLIQTVYLIAIWALITYRLDKLEKIVGK